MEPRKMTLEDALHDVGYGWGRIVGLLWAAKPPEVDVVEVKEKFGGLRFYVGTAPLEYHDLISACERVSYLVCEECGALASEQLDTGRRKTRCADCRVKWYEEKLGAWKEAVEPKTDSL